jgi:glycine betaine/proline transport system substrate-binding protein
MKKTVTRLAAVAAVSLAPALAQADAQSCATIRMSDPGWTDITSTNALFGLVAEGLGYKQKVETLAVPVTFQSIKNKDIDVFLGNWMPAQGKFIDPLKAENSIAIVRPNLDTVRYTLAVPTYVSDMGIKTVQDLAAHAKEFDGKIYGIDPGSPGNQNIQNAINGAGLKGFQVVESSEAGMLSQVDRAVRAKKPVVFLAWEPHPMNTKFKLTYLDGGDEWFGKNFGSATIYTVTRAGFDKECPNLAKLLNQVTFDVDLENRIMAKILDEGTDARVAAKAELKANPALVEKWVSGVQTLDGKDGLPAVKSALGM